MAAMPDDLGQGEYAATGARATLRRIAGLLRTLFIVFFKASTF